MLTAMDDIMISIHMDDITENSIDEIECLKDTSRLGSEEVYMKYPNQDSLYPLHDNNIVLPPSTPFLRPLQPITPLL